MWQVYLVNVQGQRVAEIVCVEYQQTAFAVCRELQPYLQEGIEARTEQA